MDMRGVKVGDPVVVETSYGWARRTVTKVARTYFYIGAQSYSRESGWLHKPYNIETRWTWTPDGFVAEIAKEAAKPFANAEMRHRDAIRAFKTGGADAVHALKSWSA